MKQGKLIWITGLSGVGKTTIAKQLFMKLRQNNPNVIHLDGDIMRKVIGGLYGHSVLDRTSLAQIYSKLCHELVNQGFVVIMSTISLFHQIHDSNRKILKDKYLEVLIQTSKEKLIERDKKNLYTNPDGFVIGINQEAQFPKNPDLVLKNDVPDDIAINIERIIKTIK